uniref:Uncharacterized protein n=1 Tax=Rhizophora mucronata TaxID=61149 RepID=A0A2P2NDT1_RHIMU
MTLASSRGILTTNQVLHPTVISFCSLPVLLFAPFCPFLYTMHEIFSPINLLCHIMLIKLGQQYTFEQSPA